MSDPLPYLTFRSPRQVTAQTVTRSGRFIPPKGAGPTAQWNRLGPRLIQLQEALAKRTLELTGTATGSVAEDVLVFVLAASYKEFFETARKIEGLEWLLDIDCDLDPGTEAFFFYEKDKATGETARKESKALNGVIYLLASNAQALGQVRTAWERRGKGLPLGGTLSKLGQLLDLVVDIRVWDWRDRLAESGIQSWKDELDAGADRLRFEAELWFRGNSDRRHQLRREFGDAVRSVGGQVISAFDHGESGYHGVLVELPAAAARLVVEEPGASAMFNHESIFHFWSVGQAWAPGILDDEVGPDAKLPDTLPNGEPEIALLDGLPVSNHPVLQSRLQLDDPDGWATDYPAASRRHGTGMASLIVHGDLNGDPSPLPRLLYSRPIMGAEFDALNNRWLERIPSDCRPNELIERCVARIKSGSSNETAAAPGVKAINLSVGDSARIFDGSPSAWARMLDWLQWRFNVLILVSAGNVPAIELDVTLTEFQALTAEQQEKMVLERLHENRRQRRLLSPAESINAVTVGSAHVDQAGEVDLSGSQILPIRHSDLPSPASCQGPGFRKSVKPDLLMPGGRQPFRVLSNGAKVKLTAYDGVKGPGMRVACPPSQLDSASTACIRGTSVATALSTRKCAFLFEQLRSVAGEPIPEEFFPVLAKGLLIHGASWGDADSHLRTYFGSPGRSHSMWKSGRISPLIGYGRAEADDLTLSNPHRATVLGWGTIAADEIQEFLLPFPDALQGQKGKKRLTVTLAWFSPINPRHRRYRIANLSCQFPSAPDNVVGAKGRADSDHAQTGRGTIEHYIFEGTAARGFPDDAFPIRIACDADAGELLHPVRYGLVVSLECAPEISSMIFRQVQDALRVPIPVGIGPAL